MNICLCGADAGYRHDKYCPRPFFRGSAAAQEKWQKEYAANQAWDGVLAALLQDVAGGRVLAYLVSDLWGNKVEYVHSGEEPPDGATLLTYDELVLFLGQAQ